MSGNNVLRLNSVEEQAAYRNAVARIIATVQRDNDLTDIDLAEKLDISVGTVSNARNRRADLSGVYLKRIGQLYGAPALDPYFALFGAKGVPIDGDPNADVLPTVACAVHQLTLVTAPASPGGATITHKELLDILQRFRPHVARWKRWNSAQRGWQHEIRRGGLGRAPRKAKHGPHSNRQGNL